MKPEMDVTRTRQAPNRLALSTLAVSVGIVGCQFATGLDELHVEETADSSSASTGGGGGGGGGDGAGPMGGSGGGTVTTSVMSFGGGGTGGMSTCSADEAGNGVEQATDLGLSTACDSAGGTVAGTIEAPEDEDWFVYVGSDSLCDTDPGVVSGNPSVTLCEYFECIDGTTPAFTCPRGTASSTASNGAAGCCGTTGNTFLVGDLACPSGEIRVWLRLLTDSLEGCVGYSIMWHF